jgi:hypothetical protein
MRIDAPVRPRNSLPRTVAFGFRIFRFPPLQIKIDYRTDHIESEKQKRSRGNPPGTSGATAMHSLVLDQHEIIGDGEEAGMGEPRLEFSN